eukprot:760394-Ditylum_brightwellii.AAC.1
MQTLTARAGYTTNNLFEELIQDQTAETLVQLAETTSSGRGTVADLVPTNVQLMAQVANYTTKMAAKDTEIATLRSSILLTLPLHPLQEWFLFAA